MKVYQYPLPEDIYFQYLFPTCWGFYPHIPVGTDFFDIPGQVKPTLRDSRDRSGLAERRDGSTRADEEEKSLSSSEPSPYQAQLVSNIGTNWLVSTVDQTRLNLTCLDRQHQLDPSRPSAWVGTARPSTGLVSPVEPMLTLILTHFGTETIFLLPHFGPMKSGSELVHAKLIFLVTNMCNCGLCLRFLVKEDFYLRVTLYIYIYIIWVNKH